MSLNHHMSKPKGSSVWHLHAKLPAELQNDKKNRKVRCSLHETDVKKARAKRDLYLGRLREEWQSQIAKNSGQRYVSYKDLSMMAVLSTTRRFKTNMVTGQKSNSGLTDLFDELEALNDTVQENVHRLVSEQKLELDHDKRLFLEKEARNFLRRQIESDIEKVMGKPMPTSPIKRVQSESVAAENWNEGVSGPITIAKAIKKFSQTKDTNGKSFATTKKYKHTFSLLVRMLDQHRIVGSLLPTDYQRIREIFEGLPVHVPDDGYLDDHVAAIENDDDRIAASTINHHFSGVRALFKWLLKSGYIRSNLAVEHLENVEKKRRIVGLPFEDNDLKKLLSRPKKDIVFWSTMIGMFTGARREEVFQLRPEDIVKRDGIWCFSHNQKNGNKVKTNGGERIIPIHSKLIEAGFLDFVKENSNNENGRLFEDLIWSEEGKWARIGIRKFDYQLNKFKIKPKQKNKRKSFHSFRYLMADNLIENKIDGGVIDALMGWTSAERREQEEKMRYYYSGRGERNTGEVPIKKLKAAMESVSYKWLKVS